MYYLIRYVHVNRPRNVPFEEFNLNPQLRYPGVQIEGMYPSKIDAYAVRNNISSDWLPAGVQVSYEVMSEQEYVAREERYRAYYHRVNPSGTKQREVEIANDNDARSAVSDDDAEDVMKSLNDVSVVPNAGSVVFDESLAVDSFD